MTTLVYQSISRQALFVFFISFLYGCSIGDPSGNSSTKLADNESIIPNSVWISDAKFYLADTDKNDSTYFLFSDLNSTDEAEIKMVFGPKKHLHSVDILGDSNLSHQLYFENGKIIFSHHIDKSAHIEWLVAYANERPYAAAAKNQGDWKAVHPEEIPINNHIIQLAEKQAKRYEEKELRHSYSYRIKESPETINGKFESNLSLSFAMNVRKDESVHLSLESTNKTIYFIVEPNNGSNMEHRDWHGVATSTGDLNITVFSVDSEPDQTFSLKAQTVSPQNLAFSPIP